MLFGMLFGEHGAHVEVARQQPRLGQRDRTDAGQRGNPVVQCVVERRHARGVIAIQSRPQAEHQQVGRIESDVDVP
jgi:hypothetical protein